jgi:hypothetical protein
VTRMTIIVWTVALLFAVAIGIWVVHEHRLRSAACARGEQRGACIQAKKTEDGAILMGVLGAVVLVVFGGVAVAMARR